MRMVFEEELRVARDAPPLAVPGALTCLLDLQLPCNMRCRGCPGTARHPASLSEEAIAGLAEALADQVETHTLRRLDVVFFGGEPLLELPRVVSLSGLLQRACAAAAVAYRGHLITNGTLLDAASGDALAAAGVRHLQVTLDGPATVHDARRPMLDGGGSWARIVDGLAAVAAGVEVVVRAPGRGLSADVERLVAGLGSAGVLARSGAALYVARPASYAQQARDLLALGGLASLPN
jgi:uncharacterized protein